MNGHWVALEPLSGPPTVRRIGWRIEGRGDPEHHTLRELEPDALGFWLPSGAPRSYDGQSFRVIWQLEIWADNQRLATHSLRVGVDTPDPYLAAGLQRNPFTLESGAVSQALWIDRGVSVAPSPPRRGAAGSAVLWQFLGVKGAGKSSHLHHWRAQQPGPYHYCAPTLRSRWTPPPVPAAGVAYWDEADRIAPLALHLSLSRAARAGSTIIAGTHHDLSRVAEQSGFSSVHTLRLGAISALQLQCWATQRVDSARSPGGTTYQVALSDAAHMLEHGADSWRYLASALHEHCAAWVSAA